MEIILCISVLISVLDYSYGLKHKNLTIGVVLPMVGSWAGGQACKPAIEMALADVNNASYVLHDYLLHMEFDDSQCKPGLGTRVFYELLYREPMKVMVLTGCSVVSTFIAQAAKMWNLIVLGYGSSSPALSNRQRFPTFFRTHPSATLHNPTRVKLFQKFGWKRIATIQETQEVFTSTVEDLEKRLKSVDMNVVVRQNFLTDPENAVQNLKRQDARIIVGVFYENMARKVFCQAYKEKLFGKKYVWFILGWYPDNWYTKYDPDINCTADQLKQALEGHFTTEAVVLHQDRTARTVSGMTSSLFQQRLDKLLNYTTDIEGYPEAPLAYDAIWALALALDKTEQRLKKRKSSLENFGYNRKDISKELYSAMNATQFLGVSGNVAFSSEGDRIAWTQIEQMTDGIYHTLGYYHHVSDNLSWFNKETWIGGMPPPDHTKIKVAPRMVSANLYFILSGLSALGICMGIFCLGFNITNRQKRHIRLSRPVLNNMTVLGCLICLACVFLLGLDQRYVSSETFAALCQVKAWLLSLGFSVGYGGMFVKIWTVHRISTANNEAKKKVKVCEPYTILVVFVIIDVIILVTWQFTDPLNRYLQIFDLEYPLDTDQDVKLQPQLELCTSKHLSVWLGVLFGYKGILLLFGIFLTYETRSVKLKYVNDSRFVGMAIYNVMVLSAITAPVSMIISDQQNAKFAFLALAVLLCTVLSMGLIFIPKIFMIMRSPKRSNFDIGMLPESQASREEEEHHQTMLQENELLKKQISQMEERLISLNRKLVIRSHQRIQLTVQQRDSATNIPTEHTVLLSSIRYPESSPSDPQLDQHQLDIGF